MGSVNECRRPLKKEWVRGTFIFNLLFFPQCICISSYHIREFLQLKRIQLPLASSAIHRASSRKGAPGIACSKQRKRTPNVRQISTSFVMTCYSSLQSCKNLALPRLWSLVTTLQSKSQHEWRDLYMYSSSKESTHTHAFPLTVPELGDVWFSGYLNAMRICVEKRREVSMEGRGLLGSVMVTTAVPLK